MHKIVDIPLIFMNNETFSARIVINSSEAQNKLKELQAERERLRKTQEALYRSQKKEDRELAAQMQRNIDSCNRKIREQQKYIKGLDTSVKNLSNASYKELAMTVKALNKELRSGHVKRNSQEWNELTRRIRECKAEMVRMNAATEVSTSVWQKFFRFLNNSWGGVTVLIGSITGLSMTVRKCVQDYADMEEAMADTRKYTGLTAAQVRELNEKLKTMDTRTAREQLNELAGAAGRLGKTSKEDIVNFVEAGNMINVALGDDLGEGAIDQIGKLTMAFGEDEKKGLREAMLATGSAVNELAQNSAAKAGYLVDFTARVGAFGKQLGLTQAQLMGFAAVMDEGLLQDEMAATAFGNMLTKMRSDTEKFARIAGMDVKEFARLIDEDANGAVLRLADNLKRQDAATMMKMLDDMGLDGSRAVAVISTLADKIDDVRRHQQLATKAYEEGSSVVDEYNTMNNTVQAELEKAKNKFHELSVELGERLRPVVTYTISAGSMAVKVLAELTDFITRYRTTLVTLTAAIIAYTVAVNGQNMAAKLQVFWNEKVIASFRSLYRVMLAHPYLAVATAVMTVVAALVDLSKKTDDAAAAARRLDEVNRQAAADAESETRTLNKLVEIARNKALSDTERRKAIEEINKISPEYLGNLDMESINTQKADVAIKNYTQSILLNAKAKRLAAQIDELEQKKMEKRNQLSEGEYSRWYDGWLTMWNSAAEKLDRSLNAAQSFVFHGNLKGWNETSVTEENGYYTNTASLAVSRYRKEVTSLEDEEKRLNEVLEQTTEQMVKIKAAAEEAAPGGSPAPPYTPAPAKSGRGGRTTTRDTTEKELRERNEAIKAANDELLAMNMAAYAAGEINYRDYLEKEQQLQLAGIRKRMELYGEGTDEYKKLQLKEQQLLRRGTEEQQQLELHDMERQHRDLIEQLKQDFEDRNSSIYQNEAALNEALFQADYDYLQLKAELYNKGSLERMQVEEETEDLLRQHQLEREQYYQESLESLRETYLGQSSEKRKTLELNALDELFRQGLIKEEEYQQARLQIQARYAQDSAAGSVSGDTASAAFKVARQQAGDANAQNPWTGDLTNLQNQTAALKEMYQNDELTHAEYLAAKAMAVDEFVEKTQEKYGAVFEQLGNLYNAASAYAKASSDYEVAVVTKNYDRQIEAAGNNQAKVKKLEEKKQKEVAAIKKKSNDRAMKMEMAQALASTAMGAINAYTSAAQVPLVGYLLAPVAAAAALAAGMLQVATIKKQHQAEAAGYYEGGYTGGRDYRKKAGVVHEGEFVANHQAVNNPAIVPFLDFIDRAQKNNTVGSLTMDDVRRTVGGSSNASVIAPVVNVQTDNEELRLELQQLRDTNEQLREAVSQGIPAYMDTEQAKKALDHLEALKAKK